MTYQLKGPHKPGHRLYEAKIKIYMLYQGSNSTNQEYLESFKIIVAIINHIDINFGENDALVPWEIDNIKVPTAKNIEE